MISAKACNILLNIIGVLAILTALFIWFWVFTVGLVISQYSYQLNNNASPFLIQAAGGIIGALVIKIGIGTFRRESWARKGLLVFWLLASYSIIAIMFTGMDAGYAADEGNFQTWLGEISFWPCVAIVGLLHAAFLGSKRVKELFEAEL